MGSRIEMTSDNQTSQPSKRFAKLDSIPPHRRMPFGLKSILARLYIARRLTLAASTAVIAVTGGAFVSMNSLSAHDTEIAVEAPTVPLEAIIEPSDAAVLSQEAAQEEQASDGAGDKPVAEEAAEPDMHTAFAAQKEEAPQPETPQPEALSVAAAENDVTVMEPAAKETASPVRQIIPITEGFDLSHNPASDSQAPIHIADKPREIPAGVGATPFTLPTQGIPSEGDLSGFLSADLGDDGSNEISVIASEDMSPTVLVPDAAPVPQARPTPSAVAGQKVEFRILQGTGIKSGFWIGNEQDRSIRRFFVIVRPFLENGTSVNWKFTNIADGSPADTDIMAVEVTEDAFIALAKESKEFGMVRDPIIGQGVAGKKEVKWRIPSVQGNLLAGWDKETRK